MDSLPRKWALTMSIYSSRMTQWLLLLAVSVPFATMAGSSAADQPPPGGPPGITWDEITRACDHTSTQPGTSLNGTMATQVQSTTVVFGTTAAGHPIFDGVIYNTASGMRYFQSAGAPEYIPIRERPEINPPDPSDQAFIYRALQDWQFPCAERGK